MQGLFFSQAMHRSIFMLCLGLALMLAHTAASFVLDLSDTWSDSFLHLPLFTSAHGPIGRCFLFGLRLFFAVIIVNNHQLCLQGPFELLAPATVILRCLKPHEDGCDGLSGFHVIENGVGHVFSINGRRGGACKLGGRPVSEHLLLLVHANVVVQGDVTGWSVAELVPGDCHLVM